MHVRRLLAVSAVLTLLSSVMVVVPAGAATPGSPTTRFISAGGTTSFTSAPSAAEVVQRNGPEIGPGNEGEEDADASNVAVDRSNSDITGSGSRASSSKKSTSNPELISSFDALNHRQQRLANGGNQFSLEPPDQGLCVGNGFVVETVNDVTRVYDQSGTPLTGVVDLNTFYGYPAQIIRPGGPYGPFVTDPSCLYDRTTNRWFMTVLTLDLDPANGAFLGPNHIDIAVSKTGDPTGAWNIYRLPVQDDGTAGTPNHHCSHGPCIGDYPHIGTDKNGFYVTTNEYSLFGPEFHGAQIYAFSKRALASGAASVAVTQFDTHGLLGANSGFTVWPSISPNGGGESSQGDAEYFLSSNAADEAHGDGTHGGPAASSELVVWALINTSRLDSANPNVTLALSVIPSERYAVPPASNQKPGPAPLLECLKDDDCATFLNGETDPFANAETLAAIDSLDSRMQQVTFANGKLWGALGTAMTINGQNKAGIAWFVLDPKVNNNAVSATVSLQGYLGLANNNLIMPSIGVTTSGKAAMAFTVVGGDYFPSAGYTGIDQKAGTGDVHIAAPGLGPQDGFSGYLYYGDPFGTKRPRWGDYGAAAVDGDNVWIASEYIAQTCTLAQYESGAFGSCGGTRTALANWGTRISRIRF